MQKSPFYCVSNNQASVLSGYLSRTIKALAIGIALATAVGQTTGLSPVRVTNIETLLKGHSLWAAGGKMVALSQSNGVWAALVRQTATSSAVILGDRESEFAFGVTGDFNDIKLDANQNILLRVRWRPKDSVTKALMFSRRGEALQSYQITDVRAEPIVVNDAFFWHTKTGIVPIETSTPQLISTANQDANNIPPPGIHQMVWAGSAARRFIFDRFSERTTAIDSSTGIATKVQMNLDKAYDLIGLSRGEKADETTGRNRVMWSAGASNGMLAVCLSETPMAGPHYVALLDPRTGDVSKVLIVQLPTDPRRIGPWNASGTIVPALGAFGDRLVVGDIDMGIVATY